MIGAIWTTLRGFVAPWLSADWLRLVIPLIVVALFAFGGWRVSVWHDAYKTLESTQEDLKECASKVEATEKAYQEAVKKAAEKTEADDLAAEETKRELEKKLAAADTSSRDLARRLRDYQARKCIRVSSTANPASGTPGSPGESGDGEEVERATSDHLAACAMDATRLEGWQKWWGKVNR